MVEREDSNTKVKEEDKNSKGGEHIGISKRSLWFMAGGALGAIAAIGIGKASKKIRPAAVGIVKEGYAFKEWFAEKYEMVMEDVEDIVVEAKHAHHKDIEASSESIKKEKGVLQRIEEALKKRIAKRKTQEG